MQPSAVKQAALEMGLAVRQPEKFAGLEQQQILTQDQADVLVVVAYGQILPAAVLSAPRLGAVNVHASLLPRWRGAAPIQRAILSGDQQTGITLMQMEAGLDTGPMLLQKSCPIHEDETAGELQDRLAQLGAECLLEGLALLEAGTAVPVRQPETGITYAHKINKSEADINWQATTETIDRQIRGFNPVPAAFTFLAGNRLKIFACEPGELAGSAEPGTVVEVSRAGIAVATADGVIRITELQPAGGKPMAAADFINSQQLVIGTRLTQGS